MPTGSPTGSPVPAPGGAPGGAPSRGATTHAADVRSSTRNATKLALSLLGTWSVGFAVRVLLPRHLGPSLFGVYQFAEVLTASLFILVTFGIETYVRREVAIRRDQAPAFYGGLLLLRALLGVLLLVGSLVVLDHVGRPPLVLQLVLLLAVAQLFTVENGTLAAFLHAVGEVDGLSIFNVASKLLWGLGAIVALLAGWGVLGVAAALLASEALKALGLWTLARRHVGLRLRVDARATRAAIVGGAPFFVAGVSLELMNRGTGALVSIRAGDTELGWYGAAAGVIGAALLLAPLVGWVLLPLTARTSERSDAELAALVRRAMGMVLTLAVPTTLLLVLGADVVVGVLFGPAYEPSVRSLRVLAPMFVFTYIAMVSSGALTGLGRGWRVTATSMVGVVVTPGLTWLLVPHTAAAYGPGGAGIGAALALCTGEALTAILLTASLGGRAFDRPRLVMLGKMAVVAAGVAAMDRLLLAGHGLPRVLVDAVVYAAAAYAWQAGDFAFVDRVLARIPGLRGRFATPG